MIIRSYSKINLSLRVLKKMKNGLHDIQSNVFLINLYDTIKIFKTKAKKDTVIFKGPFNKLVNRRNNSILKTLKILRLYKIINSSYKVIVNKKIPVFSGLGGGSGNAAFLAKFFIKRKKYRNLIDLLEKSIGSDLRLFFNKQSHQKGLSKITFYKKKYKFIVLLVYPKIKCSTKKIYSNVKTYSIKNVDYSKINSKSHFLKIIKKDKNDLQKIAIKQYPLIQNVIDYIATQKDCKMSRMTGSGSVCFGIFKNDKSASSALARIKRKFPNFWCVVTKTI